MPVWVRDYHFILFYFFRKNLNLYLIPRAKYILQQNWGFFFTTAHRHKGNPTGTCIRWTSVRLLPQDRTPYTHALAFFLILFSPHLHVYIKTRANRGISSPPLSFAIRQGSFPADVAKSVLIRFSPPPAAYRSGGPQRPLRACLYSYFYMYLLYICVCVCLNILNAKYFLL